MQILERYRQAILRRFYENIRSREDMFREFINSLCRVEYVKEVYLIGSRARGDNIPSSDFDIAVLVDRGVDVLEALEEMFKLKRQPVSVDIVVLHEEDLRDPLYVEMLRDKKRLC